MKNQLRSEITYLYWLSYVVFLSSAWNNVVPSTGQENNTAQPKMISYFVPSTRQENNTAISLLVSFFIVLNRLTVV